MRTWIRLAVFVPRTSTRGSNSFLKVPFFGTPCTMYSVHIFVWFSFIPISHIVGTIFGCVALVAKRKNDPNFFIHPTSSQGPLDSGLTYDIWSFQAGVTQHSVKPPTQVISIILRTRNSECVNWAILAPRLGTNYISWHLVEINVVVACKMQMESGRKWSGCSPLDASYCCNEHTAKAALDNSLSLLLSLFCAIFPSWFFTILMLISLFRDGRYVWSLIRFVPSIFDWPMINLLFPKHGGGLNPDPIFFLNLVQNLFKSFFEFESIRRGAFR